MSKVAIMITSCDAYKDCWKPMIFSLDKYWPDCEWPRYVVTNYADEDLPNTTIVKVGDDKRSWCNLARMGMEAIDADYILFFQEDYWLGKPVDNEAIKAHVKYMDENNVDYLKIQDDIRRDNLRIGDSDYCMNPIDMRYAFNTAIAFWRKSAMPQLLPTDWDGWKFERQITPYVKEKNIQINSQTLYSTEYASKGIKTITGDAIVRGVWTTAAVDFMKENGFEDVLAKREVMGPVNRWLRKHCPHHQSVLRWPFWSALHFLNKHKLNW